MLLNSYSKAWVYTIHDDRFTLQAELIPTGYYGTNSNRGAYVALSGDGNTALLGCPYNNYGDGAVVFFARDEQQMWTQQNSAPIFPSGASRRSQVGQGVALSIDGNTAVVGAPYDQNGRSGAIYIFIKQVSTRTWVQQAGPLVGSGFVFNTNLNNNIGVAQGYVVAISADGNTVLVCLILLLLL
jgi:hypothetical protein